MDILRVTVVGQDLFKLMEEKFELVGINAANQVSYGMLGNLKTLTYFFELREDEIIKTRKALMTVITNDNMRLMPLYVHGDWMRIFVFKPLRM